MEVTGGSYNQFVAGSYAPDANGTQFYFNSGQNNIINNVVLVGNQAVQISFQGTSANNTIIGTDVPVTAIAAAAVSTNTYTLWLPSTENRMRLWNGSTASGELSLNDGISSGLKIKTRTDAAGLAAAVRAGLRDTGRRDRSL